MLLTETFPPDMNGVAMTLSRITEGMVRRGHQVHIVRPRQGRHDRDVAPPANPSTTLVWGIAFPWYKGLNLGLPYLGQLRAQIKRFKPDFLHVATEGPLGLAGILAAHAYGVPVVSSYHTNFFAYSRFYGLGFLRRLGFEYFRALHNATLTTFAPSQTALQQLETYKYKNLAIMSRGVDTVLYHPGQRSAELRQAWGAGADDVVMLYVGRIAAEKNLELMIECYRRLRLTNPTARMVLVGDGPMRAKLQREYPHFIFAGKRTGLSLAQYYASADLFIFSSMTETYGNVIMEAMASGLVVLGYDYAAAREHVRHGENGFLAAYRKEAEFLKSFEELLLRRPDWWKIAQAARTTTQGISWENVVATYEAHLLKLQNHA